MLVVFACLTLGASTHHTKTYAATRDVSVGIAADQGPVHFAIEAQKLGGLNHATVYGTLGQDTLAYANFPRTFNIILVLRVPHQGSGGNLARIAAGAYDAQLKAFARKVKRDGRPITLRVLPEFNGHWYSWGVYKDGNTPEQFVAAWRRIVGIIRAETLLVKFDLNYNRKSSKVWNTSDFRALYPGDEWVDIVSVSSYNRCGTAQSHTTAKSFAEEFRSAYDTLVGIVGSQMPLAIAETATTSLCGVKREDWYRALFASLEATFTRVTNVTFFFVTKAPGTASNDVEVHWELETREEVIQFNGLLRAFRERLGIAIPTDVVPGERIAPPVVKHRQRGEAVTPPLDIPKEALDFSAPWTLWGKVERVEGDTFNPEINPVTGHPFGTIGTRFRFRATQGFMWTDPGSGLMVGPKFGLDGVLSDNQNRWWDNALGADARLQVCGKAKGNNIDWGRLCAFGQVRHQRYLGPVPDRLREGDTSVSIGIELGIGGDWAK